MGRKEACMHLALNVAQQQLMVLHLQDHVLSPDPALRLQHLQPHNAVIHVADVLGVHVECEEVLGTQSTAPNDLSGSPCPSMPAL